MKIATWNVNSIRTRQSQVLAWLKSQRVDVLCLQETKVVDPDFPETPFQELGYHLYVSGQKAYNGVAIFSLEPLTEVSCGFAPILGVDTVGEMDSQKRLIAGVIQGIRIVNVYVPNGATVDGEKYQYKLQWLRLLEVYLQTLLTQSPTPICICGDFNIAPEDRDIYNSEGKKNHIMCSDLERQALESITALGFQDALRKFHLETGLFSWWDYRASAFARNRGWRIDHLYLTNSLYEQAEACWIDVEPRKQVKPSDHAPVILTI